MVKLYSTHSTALLYLLDNTLHPTAPGLQRGGWRRGNSLICVVAHMPPFLAPYLLDRNLLGWEAIMNSTVPMDASA